MDNRVHVAMPPLYRIDAGKDVFYALDDDEKKGVLDTIAAKKFKGRINVQRFKGLGEMNADQLWETALKPDSRILMKVKIEDAAKADDIFSKLMGEEVSHRKHFIQTHAKEVQNLDV